MSNTYVIAEIANAHGKDVKNCLSVLEGAAKAGANAFKVATYKPAELTIKSSRPEFLLDHPVWSQFGTLWELYENIYMPWEFHEPLFKRGKELGIDVFSSPFSNKSADYLKENFDPPFYKVASFEAMDYPFVAHLARLGKPVIISMGGASLDEIERSLDTALKVTSQPVYVLHCISEYPAPASAANLRTMSDMIKRFKGQAIIGLSDHTNNIHVPMLAVALGAKMVEKHITLTKDKLFPSGIPNPDVEFSLIPDHFAALCKGIREVEKQVPLNEEEAITCVCDIIQSDDELKSYVANLDLEDELKQALGEVAYKPDKKEDISGGYRRSLLFARDTKAGEVLKLGDNITIKRPGHGLHPKILKDVEGKTLGVDVEAGQGVSFDVITEKEKAAS